MAGPSSAPRGEHTPRPGTTWQSWVEWLGEQHVPDTDTFTCPATPGTSTPDANTPRPAPPNRATRRALARANRRRTR